MASKCKTNQSGFTLVELAIALMIIGLLIGGVLKGIELVENARVTQVMRSVKAYETAMTSFQSIYSALPGDIGNPAGRLPNCTATNAPCDQTGDSNGIIGTPNTTGNMPATPDDTDEERTFWLHLAVAGLISGVDSTGATSPGSTVVWGKEYPAAPVIGSGFMIQNLRLTVGGARFQGHYVALRGVATTDGVLTGNQALQIDTKFDDAAPRSGDIFVATDGSIDNGCLSAGPPPIYVVNSDVKSCVLYLRLSK